MSSTQRIKNQLIKILSFVHNSLFPARCAGCKIKGTYLCDICNAKIPRRGNYGDKAIFSVVPYNHPTVKQLIWLLKYRGVRDIAETFSDWLYEALLEDLAETKIYREQAGKILIIPIPLTKKRLRERGFNQAEEIAKHLVIIDPKLFRLESNNLIRIKNTPTQVSVKNRTERLNNLKGVFNIVNRKNLRGRTIILLDDVATTGTTLAEAEKALNHGRPRRVIKVTVAGG